MDVCHTSDSDILTFLVTPTERRKSVRSRCVVERFGGVFVMLFGLL